VLKTLNGALMLAMASMAKAHEGGERASVAGLGSVVARLGDLLLTVGAVKAEHVEVEHSGRVDVTLTQEEERSLEDDGTALARRLWEKAKGGAIDAEVVE
jgi:hypothetical protein